MTIFNVRNEQLFRVLATTELHTLGHMLRGGEEGTSSFMYTPGIHAWCRDSTQDGVHEADIGSFLCCNGDSLEGQCT